MSGGALGSACPDCGLIRPAGFEGICSHCGSGQAREIVAKCLHPQGHEWEARARLSEFVLWRCLHCPEQSATRIDS